MELRHLQSFAVAARRLSFTQAARELHLTQAAISQHVAALERELGVRLFERVNRTVSLTPAGERLAEFAAQMLALHDAAVAAVGSGATTAGRLRIAASTVPAQVLLPDLLAEFRRRFPQIREAIAVSSSAAAMHAVQQGDADVGLVGEPPEAKRPLDAVAIGHDELVLVVSASHPLAARDRLTRTQFLQTPLIVRESGSGSRQCLERALAADDIAWQELHICMEMNSNDAIRDAVERGTGAAFLSRATLAGPLAAGKLVALPVAGCRPQRELYVIARRRDAAPAIGRRFYDFVLERRVPKK